MITISPGGLIASLLTSLLLISGCSQDSAVPFEIDTSSGTFTFSDGKQPSGPFQMILNGQSILENSFLFQEDDSLVSINSLGEIDFISVYKGYSSAGIIRISFVNAGKENHSVSEFHLLAVRANSEMKYDLLCTNESPWRLFEKDKEDTLLFSLQNHGIPIILLPGEKLELPQINLVKRGISSTL